MNPLLVTLNISVEEDGTAHTQIICGDGRNFLEVFNGLKICLAEIQDQLARYEECPMHNADMR